jgi:hypothetical protein
MKDAKRINQIMDEIKNLPYDLKSGEINLYYIIRKRGNA